MLLAKDLLLEYSRWVHPIGKGVMQVTHELRAGDREMRLMPIAGIRRSQLPGIGAQTRSAER